MRSLNFGSTKLKARTHSWLGRRLAAAIVPPCQAWAAKNSAGFSGRGSSQHRKLDPGGQKYGAVILLIPPPERWRKSRNVSAARLSLLQSSARRQARVDVVVLIRINFTVRRCMPPRLRPRENTSRVVSDGLFAQSCLSLLTTIAVLPRGTHARACV